MKFLFTGDTALVGSAESTKSKSYSLKISEEVKKLFGKDVFSVVNLEAPLTHSEKTIPKTGPNIKSNPESIQLLKDLNIDLACLSNNHIRDYGDRGVSDTIKHCQENNIDTVGAGGNLQEAAKPFIFNKEGQSFAILNFSEQEYNTVTKDGAGSNPDDEIHIWRSIHELRGNVDAIIVIMHGGKEMYPYPTPEQMKLYRFIIDIGVDIVIGHHSHVIGGYEFYNDKPIIYSLGNFIFDEEGNQDAWYNGAIAEVEFSDKEIKKLNVFKTSLRKSNLEIVDEQDLFTKSETGFFHQVLEEDVQQNWYKLIHQHIHSAPKSLLNFGLLRRILWKMGYKKLNEQDERRLMILGNRLRCRTHREFYKSIIDRNNT
jgi:poly-gamma-glutamate capsule biosynthesis protein CapA/YwtB (metallophosphatase superfamily)